MEIIIIISILFQLAAVVIAIKLINITEKYFAWLLVSAAVILMSVRRVITLVAIFNGKIVENAMFLPEITALMISILASTGLYFMIPIFRNIKKNESELVHKNSLLLDANARAEESNRLKSAFLQNLSHEIRTPMNAIMGFSDLLHRTDFLPEKKSSFVSIIQASSKQLLSIVTDILTIAAIETSQEKTYIKEVDVNGLLNKLLNLFQEQASHKKLSFSLKLPLSDDEAEVLTDGSKLNQILTNLLNNAFKFTYEGFIEFGYNLKDNNLEFYVKDSGIGIEPNHKEKIFEHFNQAEYGLNRKYGGTGLGLSISKGFVGLLGGNIWVTSEYGKGSTFYFTLPYTPVRIKERGASSGQTAGKVKTVLVAEDEDFNYLLIQNYLQILGLNFVHARNGQEAVDACKTNPSIDLVLMDIKMPIMDGYTAALEIKKFRPDLPVIAQTAYALDHEIEKYNGAFDAYITKPIAADVLREKITGKLQKKE
jgi:signal transduction histidine kinase/CheY-like chemotaxis protein